MKDNERVGIVIHGAPGSGKGFIAEKYIKEHPDVEHISVGDHVRNIANNQTSSSFKNQVDFANKNKLLLPDDISAEIVEERVGRSIKRIQMIDGFPQRPGEFEHFLGHTRIQLLGMITLQVCESTALQRMQLRGLREGEASDFDVLEYYRQRYQKYIKQYQELSQALSGRLPIKDIDAEGNQDTVYSNFQLATSALLKRAQEDK